MRISGSKILVVGGSGFVGSHIVDQLLKEDVAEVVVFDKAIQRDNLAAALESNRVRLIQGDITRVDELAIAMRGIDGLFHLAVLPLGDCAENPRACLEINVVGTFNVIEAAKHAGVGKIIFSSASSVYGDTTETMDESHPLNARTMYGASKIAGEYFLRAFYDMYKLDYVILRYMNVYGPRQKGGVIMSALKRIKEGLPPIIYGDGSQSFDFVYVSDVAMANILAMKSDVTDEVFNIGSGEETTIKELVYALLEITGSDLTPEFRRDERVLMQRRVGSSEKAARMLGYIPKVPLHEGLRRVVEEEFAKGGTKI